MNSMIQTIYFENSIYIILQYRFKSVSLLPVCEVKLWIEQ